MRVVPATNTQKSSGPRLQYRAFVGAKLARLRGEWNYVGPDAISKRTRNGPCFATIDWGDQKHFWRLVPAECEQEEHGQLENAPEAVEACASGLQGRFSGRPVAVCLE
jgi:hypothetical protein